MQKFTKFFMSIVMLFVALAVNAETKTISVSWPADAIDATGADAIELNGFYFVGNNSKVTLTKNGFYTGGGSSASARHIYYTPSVDGKLAVEGTASGDNTDRYLVIGISEPALSVDAANALASVAIPEKGKRHTVEADLHAGSTYYITIVGNGTFTNLSYTYEEAPAKTPFDITGVTMNWMGETIEAGAEVDALSYMFNVVSEKEGLAAGEGHIEFTDAEGNGIGVGAWNGYYLSFMSFGQEGYTTPGTYTLTIPAGALVDAEGNPCNEYKASWTVKAAEVGSFAITGASNYGVAGNDTTAVEALSYIFEIYAENAIVALHEGNITLTDADNQPVGGNATVVGYEDENGANTVYARFTFDTEDHLLHTSGKYTLNVPAGMFKDAEGNLNEAYTATWTVVAPEKIAINDGFNVEISTTTTQWGDTKYVATLTVNVPETVKEVDCEGLLIDGTSNGFQKKNITIENGVLTAVFEDILPCAQDDPDGSDLRAAGTYTASATIVLMDSLYAELGAANFIGSIVLPELEAEKSAIADAEWANLQHGTIAADEAVFGIKLVLPNVKVEDEMEQVVVAAYLTDLDPIDPEFGIEGEEEEEGIDSGFGIQTPETFNGIYDVETGLVTVNLFPEDGRIVAGGSYKIDVAAIYVGQELAWVAEEETLSVEFTVDGGDISDPEPIAINDGFNVEISTTTTQWGDTKYVATLTVEVPENVAVAYCEGLLIDGTNMGFSVVEESTTIENGVLTMVFTDMMKCALAAGSEPVDLRAAGTYTASAMIVLGDADWNELGAANYTGSIVLPEVGEPSMIAGAEWGLMHGHLDADMINMGIKLTLPNVKVADEMEAVVVYANLTDLDPIDPEFGIEGEEEEEGLDMGYGFKFPDSFVGYLNPETDLVEVWLYPGDERIVAGGSYKIDVVGVCTENTEWLADVNNETLSVEFDVIAGPVIPEENVMTAGVYNVSGKVEALISEYLIPEGFNKYVVDSVYTAKATLTENGTILEIATAEGLLNGFQIISNKVHFNQYITFTVEGDSREFYISNENEEEDGDLVVTEIEEGKYSIENLFIYFNGKKIAKVSNIVLTLDKIATGINNATVAKTVNAKFVKNGKLVIVKNGVEYNAAGVQVK